MPHSPPSSVPPTLRPDSGAHDPRPRILFVDDEPQILEALQNTLRRQRRTWDMVFAIGGEAALAELERAPIDIVVSDMRMPGMDGATFLTHVKARFPGVARIVLSGHADQDAIFRALPVAHQFLSKPCDAGHLRAVLERTCALQQLIHNDTVRRAAGRLDRLPSAANIYWELTRVLGDSNATLDAMASVVERDPAMSAKVLQLVNSAYFGLPRRVSSIVDAVRYLGTDTLKGLALTAQVFSIASTSPLAAGLVDRLCRHALGAARLARQFLADDQQAEDAFAAALLHDVGQLILAVGVPEVYEDILADAAAEGRTLEDMEYLRLGASHAEVGAYLLGVWGLPFAVVEAVAYHHRPGLAVDGNRGVLAAVHAADALLEDGPAEAALDATFLEPWAGELPRWQALADSVRGDYVERPAELG